MDLADFVNILNSSATLLAHVPMRVENIEKPAAQFSFIHKTIGEFLAALAFWDDPMTALQMTAEVRATAFSLREPNVLRMFHDMSRSSLARRDLIAGWYLMNALCDSQQTSETVKSNSLAMIAASDYPFQAEGSL